MGAFCGSGPCHFHVTKMIYIDRRETISAPIERQESQLLIVAKKYFRALSINHVDGAKPTLTIDFYNHVVRAIFTSPK